MSLTNLAVRVGKPEGERLRLEIEPMAGAKVFAAERRPRPFMGHASGRLDIIDAPSVDVAWPLREIQANHFATTTDPAPEHRRVSRISREKPR